MKLLKTNRKADRDAEKAIRRGNAWPLTDRHLNYLTKQELERYMRTGKLPPFWRLRRKKVR